MTLTTATLMQDLESLYGRDFETIVTKRPFIMLFHDSAKLRIRLEERDISVPISILLLGIAMLLAKRKFSKRMSVELLGKDWGFGYIARLLLECEDVCVGSEDRELTLMRVKLSRNGKGRVKPPPNGKAACNPEPARIP